MPQINPEDLPNTVGESVFVPAENSDNSNANDEHYITLEDPEGAMTKKFHCEQCGAWYTSALNFEYTECIPNDRV